MRDIASNPKVMLLGKINNIQMIIESLLNQLQHCQNTLTTYMTGKRDLFPRFYFLSDDDLLEILGQSSKENILQKHIGKLFPGVNKLELSTVDKATRIKSIKSAEDDNVKLLNEISTADAVEIWLNTLDKEIKNTLKHSIKLCYQRNEALMSLETVEKFPMQVLCLINLINFTAKLEKSITVMSLQNTLTGLKSDISHFSLLLQKSENSLTQLKIRALLFDMVHHVTTVEYLTKHNVTNLNDWHWLQQIKFYYNTRNEAITIKSVNAEFEYSYEFLGNYNKLVYTTLTHNCYLTLTQAMYLGLGGNPFGPAGTGKTECVKSLGAMMGRMVLVFNCNENIDTSAMALILTGISRCGAWACFDEFNRLQEETLSAIAMLIQPLQVALKEKQEVVHLLDKNVRI
jgi:dynein heavy chain 2